MRGSRRSFLTQAGLAAAATPLSATARPSSSSPKLATQEPSSEENFRRFARYGVSHVCGWYRIADAGRLHPTLDELNLLTDMAARHRLVVEMTDTAVGRGAHSALMLGGDGRAREIEAFQETIRACARAGIPSLKYYLSILPILRLDKVPGRADTQYWRWNYEVANSPDGEQRMSRADQDELRFIRQNYPGFDADLFWERVDYVLERVVPVANEYKVRIAQHPHDPGMGPAGIAGIPSILGTVEGLQRFVSLHESPYHGLNFCQGTICENLDNPRAQLPGVIRWFGSRRKIFNVHFRNIKGHRNDFVAETFPDDGDVDMTQAVRTYREVGYDGMLMPDHIPELAGGQAQDKAQMFAFGYGYIRALIQATA